MSSVTALSRPPAVARLRGGRGLRRAGIHAAALLPWVLPVAVAGGWEIGGRLGWLNSQLLPTPSIVFATIYELAETGELWLHFAATLWRMAFGFGFGVAAATLLGALSGYSSFARRLLDPTLQALRNVPSIAWVPLFILWFGIFETSKVILIAVGAFFPIYLNLALGIQQVDRKLVEVGRVYRFSPAQMIARVLLPAALPAYIAGLRGGLGLAWMFVVAAELMGAGEGLGYLLADGQMTLRPDVIIAAITLFAVLGKATDLLLAAVGARLLRWQDSFKPQG